MNSHKVGVSNYYGYGVGYYTRSYGGEKFRQQLEAFCKKGKRPAKVVGI